jgi:hypothetical protein
MGSKWQRCESLKSRYLKAVERELARTSHPRKDQVLAGIQDHLEQSFHALPPEERTSARMQEVIEDMGVPEEYAELLSPGTSGIKVTVHGITAAAARKIKERVTGRLLRRLGSVVGATVVLPVVLLSAGVLPGLRLLVVAATAAVLGRQYRRTRDPGFIWLAVALVIWPVAAMPLLRWSSDLLSRIHWAPRNVATATSHFFRLCESALVLLALTRLHRPRKKLDSVPVVV